MRHSSPMATAGAKSHARALRKTGGRAPGPDLPWRGRRSTGRRSHVHGPAPGPRSPTSAASRASALSPRQLGAKDWIAAYEATRPPFRLRTWEMPQRRRLLVDGMDVAFRHEVETSALRAGSPSIVAVEHELFERLWNGRSEAAVADERPARCFPGIWEKARAAARRYRRAVRASPAPRGHRHFVRLGHALRQGLGDPLVARRGVGLPRQLGRPPSSHLRRAGAARQRRVALGVQPQRVLAALSSLRTRARPCRRSRSLASWTAPCSVTAGPAHRWTTRRFSRRRGVTSMRTVYRPVLALEQHR